MLWDDIRFYIFCRAYEEPRNDDFIRRVYAFAEWSVKQTKAAANLVLDDLSDRCYGLLLRGHLPVQTLPYAMICRAG